MPSAIRCASYRLSSDERRAETCRRVGSPRWREHDAHAKRRQARIGISKAHGCCARAVPCRKHAEHLGQILDHDARAQLVEIEFVDQRFRALARATSRKKPPPSLAGASVAMKSAMILPCGVSSAQKRAAPGPSSSMSALTSPCRKLRASSPATFTTPRSESKAAFIDATIPRSQSAGPFGEAKVPPRYPQGSLLPQRWSASAR